MQLDDVVPSLTTGPRVGEAMERSVRWLDRCIEFHQKSGRDKFQNLFAIVQGGLDPESRRQCLERMVQRKDKVAGFAIGGLSGGEAKGGNARHHTHKLGPIYASDWPVRYLLENVGGISGLRGIKANLSVVSSNAPKVFLQIVSAPSSRPTSSYLTYFRSQICDGYRFR